MVEVRCFELGEDNWEVEIWVDVDGKEVFVGGFETDFAPEVDQPLYRGRFRVLFGEDSVFLWADTVQIFPKDGRAYGYFDRELVKVELVEEVENG